VSAGALSVDKYCTDAIVEGWTTFEERWNSDELYDTVAEE
jgi:hypothetical protein